MATKPCLGPSIGALKRIKVPQHRIPAVQRASFSYLDMLREYDVDIRDVARKRGWKIADKDRAPTLDAATSKTLDTARLPRNVQAIYLAPLRRNPQHEIPCCDLQLRSYSIRNLELFSDFAMRAAYYLGLPAKGPVPLPRITERWTVPRGNFVHKKSQENFERVTLRRLIQIQDGHPDTVQVWLGYLQKKQYHGVGMKANLWEHEEVGVGKRMEHDAKQVLEGMEGRWNTFGRRKEQQTAQKIEEILQRDPYKRATDGAA